MFLQGNEMASVFGSRLKVLAIEAKDYYSDINLNFAKDVRSNDVGITSNATAIQYSILGIVGTRKGERPFYPSFGCDIHGSLFENMNDASMVAVEKSVATAIRNFEPRVKLERVLVTPIYDQNTYIVTIYYRLITDLNYILSLKMELSS